MQKMQEKKKNHLIMINITLNKEVNVILEYLATKQIEAGIEYLVLRT